MSELEWVIEAARLVVYDAVGTDKVPWEDILNGRFTLGDPNIGELAHRLAHIELGVARA